MSTGAAAVQAKALAEHAAALAELALAAEHCCPELAECAEALAELVLAVEGCRQELADCAAVVAEMTLPNECCCLEAAKCGATLEETALAEEQRRSLLAAQATELVLAAKPGLGQRTSGARRKLPQINAGKMMSALWCVATIVQRDVENGVRLRTRPCRRCRCTARRINVVRLRTRPCHHCHCAT